MTFPDTTFVQGTTITSNWLNAVNDVCENNQDFVSVKSFGAIGDGITDDTVAIQAALNATPNGGKLYIPTGTYLISTGLTRINSITLQGDGVYGSGGTVLNYTGNGVAFTYGGGGGASAGARFQDFRIAGTSSGTIGFKIYNAYNAIKLDKVYVEDFTSGDALYVEDAWDIEFSKCTFRTSNNGVNCGDGFLYGVVNNCTWISCDIINNDNIGLKIYSGSNNNIIGCDFSGTNKIAIDLASALTTTTNHACLSNMISGCYFEGQSPATGSEQFVIRIGAAATISPASIQGNVIDKPYMDFAGDYIGIYNAWATVIRDPQVGTVAAGKKAIIIDSSCARTKIEWQSRANITDNSTTTNYYTNDVLTASGDIYGNFNTPTRSAFNVQRSTVNNVTGNGTKYLLTSDAEQKDVLNEVSNGVFTATVRGMYQFNVSVQCQQVGLSTRVNVGLDTSNKNYDFYDAYPAPQAPGGSQYVTGSVTTWMDAGDTAQAWITVSGLAGDTVDVAGNFSGYLVG